VKRESIEELRAGVDRIGWWHTMELAPGVVTPGEDETPRKLEWLRLPERLDGKTVLDIGAWYGAFSFEAERRGAARVVALDTLAWHEPAFGPKQFGTKAGFEFARKALGSRVEDMEVPLEEISPERVGTYDVVLFLGVLYHIRDPWEIFQRAASVCRDLLILETHVDLLHLRRPAMAFIAEDDVLRPGDNFWGPNVRLLERWVREAGFAHFDVVHREKLPYRLARAAYRRVRGPRVRVAQGRVAIHARR
jgi:tRNA (mo5U34)-methyltransferase